MAQTYDVLIVGNGVLGLSSAYALALQEPSLKIAVLGPAEREGSATLAAGAMLNCFAEVNKCTLSSPYGLSKFTLAREALHLWPTWLSRLNAELSPLEKIAINPGTFILLNSKAGKREDQNYEAILHTLNTYHEPYEVVDPSTIPGLDPIDDARPLKACYLPREGSISPHRLLKALELVAAKIGNLTFIDDETTQVLLTNHTVIGVETKVSGTLKASKVLLAAGAYTQALLDKIPALKNRVPKILASSGTSLLLQVKDHSFKQVVRTPVRTGSCGVHLMPCHERKERLYLGASSSVRLLPRNRPKARDIHFLIENTIEQFNRQLRDAEIVKYSVGNRPVSFDTLPLIGATSITGLWILSGTYRDGLHCSPALATAIANEILTGTISPLVEAFRPERPPRALLSKEAAIEELVDQYISAGYEHGMKLPKMCWMSDINTMAQTLIHSMYEQLEIDMGLAPDIFIMLHYTPELIPFFRDYYKATQREFPSTASTDLQAKVHG